MSRGRDRGQPSVETQAVAAQRAYLEALAAWDRTLHLMNCPICRPPEWSAEEGTRRCEAAEAEKERRRIVFRDLCDRLGYVPTGHGITLPDDSWPCLRGRD